jgi:hypothetical protein
MQGENMKTGFSDPLEVKEGKKKKSPWDFECPPYDERTSCYVNAGTHFGVGHRQPVGHEGKPKMDAATLPRHKSKTMRIDEIPTSNLPLDIEI